MPGISPGRRAAENKRPHGHASYEESPDSKRAAPAKRRRVLVVEDNLDTVRSMTLLLREMGHDVEYAINGYAGLEAARRFRPNIVLLDLGLPGMDGFELCRKLRREPELKSVRVIAITGYSQEDYRARSKEAGCDLHLHKPVDPRVLKDILE
jgi:CheY-like chemotaxis protein